MVNVYIERMLPNAVHFKEFYGGYHGTCGETANATALVCTTPPIESKQDAINLMLSMTKEMIGLGWADRSGSTTTRNLYSYDVRHGYSVYNVPFTSSKKVTHNTFIGYQEPLDMDWLHELLLSQAGVRPIVLEVSHAGNLDSLNGGNDERSVRYHFITIVGINKDGYVCNDGDNSAIEQHLVLYPWSELQQAVPCGVLILEMKETPVATQQQPYEKVFNDAINAEKARDALQVENAQLKQQLADALAMIADLKAHATSPSGVVLTQKQKDALAAFEELQKALAE